MRDAHIIKPLVAAGSRVVFPPKKNRKQVREHDKHLYKECHLVEHFFCELKQLRAIATRYDKTAQNFLAAIYLAAAFIWLAYYSEPSLNSQKIAPKKRC
ncbi:transposase [Undibacterium sp. Ji49W]|uniref:transposase n=1 Tax=Undibacterium sp. Ji49W TaxID=3413040 RepID=UPI003BF112FE